MTEKYALELHNKSTVKPQLSELQLSKPLIIQTEVGSVLFGYFVKVYVLLE